jgi:hypothetical protein
MIKCYCIICKKYIGSFHKSQSRQTCSKKCYALLVSKNTEGKNNGNYKHGKTIHNECIDCHIEIDHRASRCNKCKGKIQSKSRKGTKLSKKTKELIGKRSKEKFTKSYMQKIRNRFQGNKKITNGYILIKDYNHPHRNWANDIMEHRLVVEKVLGRYLTKKECVHHIDMTRNNNSPSNLYLCKNKSENLKIHASLNKLVKQLLDHKIIDFKNGNYCLSEWFKNKNTC